MYPSAERIDASQQAGAECLFAIAGIQAAVSERFAALTFNAVKAVVEDCLKHAKARLGARDATESIALSSEAFQHSAEEAIAYLRSAYDVALQAHGEIIKVMEALVTDLDRRIAHDLDKARTNPASPSGLTAAAVKSALAAAGSTYQDLNRISMQTSRLMEAGFTAAMQEVKAHRKTTA